MPLRKGQPSLDTAHLYLLILVGVALSPGSKRLNHVIKAEVSGKIRSSPGLLRALETGIRPQPKQLGNEACRAFRGRYHQRGDACFAVPNAGDASDTGKSAQGNRHRRIDTGESTQGNRHRGIDTGESIQESTQGKEEACNQGGRLSHVSLLVIDPCPLRNDGVIDLHDVGVGFQPRFRMPSLRHALENAI